MNKGGYNTQSFSKDNFIKLEELMYEQQVKRGETIYWEGNESNHIYYLISGAVKLTKSSDEGKDLVLYHFQAGDLFGEFHDDSHAQNSFSAEAMTDCSLGIIQQKDLETILWQNGDLAIEFMKWMGYMQRFTQTKLRDLMFFGKHGALASTLIRIANTYGVEEGPSIRMTTKFTNTELADLIGATRETVNRMLNQLKKDEIIAYDGGAILIEDLDKLKAICHCEGCPKNICRL
ncbi:Crp/Fnr family transcriptional regulator [Alkalihalobacillus hwajinpoensis]|nr:Crp/Fnr family transcriptional regulator [Pseudalkalibacillus hwajinpoensis]